MDLRDKVGEVFDKLYASCYLVCFVYFVDRSFAAWKAIHELHELHEMC